MPVYRKANDTEIITYTTRLCNLYIRLVMQLIERLAEGKGGVNLIRYIQFGFIFEIPNCYSASQPKLLGILSDLDHCFGRMGQKTKILVRIFQQTSVRKPSPKRSSRLMTCAFCV